MAREIKLNFSDFKDARQVQQRMGLSSHEMMQQIRKHTQQQGMGDRELEKFCQKVFTANEGDKQINKK